MDVAAFLEEICALPGFSGMEGTVAARIAEEFKKYSDNVRIDKMGNVRAIMGQGGPKVMVAAHMDEVGLWYPPWRTTALSACSTRICSIPASCPAAK